MCMYMCIYIYIHRYMYVYMYMYMYMYIYELSWRLRMDGPCMTTMATWRDLWHQAPAGAPGWGCRSGEAYSGKYNYSIVYSNSLEGQWPILMGYFGVWWPVISGPSAGPKSRSPLGVPESTPEEYSGPDLGVLLLGKDCDDWDSH